MSVNLTQVVNVSNIDTFHSWKTKINSNTNLIITGLQEIISSIGTLTGLDTTEQLSIVGALNEVLALADSHNALLDTIGTVSNLNTVAKTNLVLATNELNGKYVNITQRVDNLDIIVNNLTNSSIVNLTTTVGNLTNKTTTIGNYIGGNVTSDLTTTNKTLIGSINELKNMIGNLSSLNTINKSSIVASINSQLP